MDVDVTSLENGKSSRGRSTDPLTLQELPVDRMTWVILDRAAYAPGTVRILVENWEQSNGIVAGARVDVASFRTWTRGAAGKWGAYAMSNPLRQGIAFSNEALEIIYKMLSTREGGAELRSASIG
jgi:hypothetical protein